MEDAVIELLPTGLVRAHAAVTNQHGRAVPRVHPDHVVLYRADAL